MPSVERFDSNSTSGMNANDKSAPEVQAAVAEASTGEKKGGTCLMRGSDTPSQRLKHETGGAICAVCACGYPQAPTEMPEAEGCRAILAYIIASYRDEPFVRPEKDMKYIGFDDMCHLMRYAEKVKDLHPKIAEFVAKTRTVVDKFHFRNHVGEYCRKCANPYI